ncbi:MAG: peptidylprolyl isomerase [Paludisphaera borealis]|uniref:peptidylprolyl isomerase n=1 Tax=Paludisphaera borealis TaxID=1387353 RepID=UPI00284858A7|nr:peptidylprolyl isomerase [Paludisphaera borealis]MDR3619705.1 peptidylprolyl isomerase [Paludisphaera borealis]
MRRIVLTGLATLAATGVFIGAETARAQTAPAQKPGAAPAPAAANAPIIANAGEVVATVSYNDATEKITKGDVFNIITRYPIPATEDREQVYRDAVDTLVNTKLVTQFLNRQRITIPPAKIDEELAKLEQGLKSEGKSLESTLRENGFSPEEIRKEIQDRLRWIQYVNLKATDAELKRYVADHHDLFSGTQIRASHILLKTDPNASAADKEKVKQKLTAIKNDIETSKISFAEAANKFSEDPANAGGGGGDLDFFNLSSGFIPEFTDVAFKLKKGSVSNPVETPYGYHLIQVTDRKEGRPVDLEQNKPYVTTVYAGELQKNLLTEARKAANIEVKPMPKDLYPPVPTQAAPAATKPAAAAKAKAKAG